VLRHPPTSGDPKKTERPESIPADRPIDHPVAGHQAVHPDTGMKMRAALSAGPSGGVP